MISVRQTARKLRQSNKGNAMMILALGLPALVGGAGYGLDMAQWYMWKRELQYAVDQAAVAGAYSLSYKGAAGDWATRAEQEYDANRSVTTGYASASTSNPTIANYGAFTQNSVIVTATMSVKLPFSSILSNSPTVINVRSQAKFDRTPAATGCLIALKTTGTVITLNGNVSLNAPCGMAAPSADGISINKSGGSGSVNPGWVYTAGGVSDKFQEKVDAYNATASTADQIEVNTGSTGFVNPFDGVTAPTVTSPATENCAPTMAQPGVFSGGLDVSCDMHFAPGVYVIDGGSFKNNNSTITGTDVLFVLKNNATIDFGGNSTSNFSGLTATSASALGYSGTQKDQMTGMVFMEDPATTTTNNTHKWRGNSGSNIDGRMYFPKGTVDIAGTPSTGGGGCTIIVAYTIEISGDAEMSSGCESSGKAVQAVQENTRVRLVI